MTPLVSILVPAYNAERWVGDALQSALAQTWPRCEIIAVDDGSSDTTLAVLRQFASRGVKVMAQSNKGASTARNVALAEAQGDFIQWLDADDLLAPDKVARQIAAWDGDPNTLLTSPWGRFRACPARARFVPTSMWTDLAPLDWVLRKFEHNDWMAIESWLVSRVLSERAGPWNETLSMDDDGDYFSRVVGASARVAFAPGGRSYIRRLPSGSLSQGLHSTERLTSQVRSLELQVERLLAAEDSPRTRAASLKYLQRWLGLLYPEHPTLVARLTGMASRLGGELAPPDLGWKYAAVQGLLGPAVASRVRLLMPRLTARTRFWLEYLECRTLLASERVGLSQSHPTHGATDDRSA